MRSVSINQKYQKEIVHMIWILYTTNSYSITLCTHMDSTPLGLMAFGLDIIIIHNNNIFHVALDGML